ncbi:MAG: hypothetical protein ACOYKA_01820 [Legionellaceae bacterium]
MPEYETQKKTYGDSLLSVTKELDKARSELDQLQTTLNADIIKRDAILNSKISPQADLDYTTDKSNKFFGIPISGGFKTMINFFRPHITSSLEHAQSRSLELSALEERIKMNQSKLPDERAKFDQSTTELRETHEQLTTKLQEVGKEISDCQSRTRSLYKEKEACCKELDTLEGRVKPKPTQEIQRGFSDTSTTDSVEQSSRRPS